MVQPFFQHFLPLNLIKVKNKIKVKKLVKKLVQTISADLLDHFFGLVQNNQHNI